MHFFLSDGINCVTKHGLYSKYHQVLWKNTDKIFHIQYFVNYLRNFLLVVIVVAAVVILLLCFMVLLWVLL